MNPHRILCAVGIAFLLPVLGGCGASNALFFHEQAKFGMSAELQGDQTPLDSHIAYKRRIMALVPPKKPSKEGCSEDETGKKPEKCLHEGEALSMISYFNVRVSYRDIDSTSLTERKNGCKNSTPVSFNGGVAVDTNIATGPAAVKIASSGSNGLVTDLLAAKIPCETANKKKPADTGSGAGSGTGG